MGIKTTVHHIMSLISHLKATTMSDRFTIIQQKIQHWNEDTLNQLLDIVKKLRNKLRLKLCQAQVKLKLKIG